MKNTQDPDQYMSCIRMNCKAVIKMCDKVIASIILFREEKDAEVLKRRRLPERRKHQFFGGRIQFGKWLPEETDSEVWRRIGTCFYSNPRWEYRSSAHDNQLQRVKLIKAAAKQNEGHYMFLSIDDFANINY